MPYKVQYLLQQIHAIQIQQKQIHIQGGHTNATIEADLNIRLIQRRKALFQAGDGFKPVKGMTSLIFTGLNLPLDNPLFS